MSQVVFVAPTLAERTLVRAGAQHASSEGIQVLACGIGPGAAAAFVRRLDAARPRPDGLALIGWAGGLDPDLAPGDVVLADRALDERGESVPCTVIHLPGTEIGTLLTVAVPLLTPQAKRAARTRAARASSPVAVEMEAYPLAAWAWQHEVPFIHARVILDAADEALPDLADVLDSLGRVLPGRLARRLLQQPQLIVPLLRLVIRAQRIGPVLTRVTRAIVQAVIST